MCSRQTEMIGMMYLCQLGCYRVLNRIFHTEDKYTAWNGAVNNDPLKLCQNGAYVYFIVARDNEGITTEYKGSVVLIADY